MIFELTKNPQVELTQSLANGAKPNRPISSNVELVNNLVDSPRDVLVDGKGACSMNEDVLIENAWCVIGSIIGAVGIILIAMMIGA